MSKEETYFNKTASQISDAKAGKLFGKLCYKINGKAFCCFFEQAMVFKLNDPFHKEALILSGSKLFDPAGKGRPMKEWVQVSFKHKKHWSKFAEAAANYVLK